MEKTKLQNAVNLHWWQGSCEHFDRYDVRKAIEALYFDILLTTVIWEEGGGINGYQKTLRFGEECWICFDDDLEFNKKIHNGKMTVVFKGEFFDKYPVDKLIEFGYFTCECHLKVTRFDVYLQDYNRVVEISQINQHYKDGCCRGFQSRRYIDSDSRNKKAGETLELGRRGSRGSGKFLRIYDKELQSLGEILGIRWELEYSGDRAISAWDILIRAKFNIVTMAGMVLAASDWIQPTADQHKKRWKRLDWYQELIDGTELVTVPIVREKTNIDKKVRWVEQSVSGSLAYIRAFLHFVDQCNDGFEGLMAAMVDEGGCKLKKSHYEQLQIDIGEHLAGRDMGLSGPTVDEIQAFCEAA